MNDFLNPTHPRKVLVFGCGYLGIRVAQASLQRGDEVFATTRTEDRATQLESLGFHALRVDWNDRRTLEALPTVDRVLIAVAHDPQSRVDRYDSQVGGLKRLLDQIDLATRVCYISTTGVYHQTDGSWVDENSAARANRPGGKAHLMAEAMLRRMRARSSDTV
ncbi:MAG: NAD-dependent epimerase/dehydratase family protein, partial [Planctomycetota bacterium]